ncbi:Adenylate kinase [Roseimaritima multifibrata]|uniref:Adenylate kinase n=1 Tax=Roseimaritima multifibrata TaxID=1930274 RepID=A0A517MKZ0_9BACT|nr:nucleoside monophosphate kinase [Roseimaritima multifibrata]QDS95551.1 Adenylate kinase [Roseimaritima multifibrata]
MQRRRFPLLKGLLLFMSPNPVPPAEVADLEIKDAQLIFKTVWEQLEEEIGHEFLRFPKELILLGGAPGAGKGTHTRFVMQARGLTCPPIVISDLLVTREAMAIKDSGGMVGDKEVVAILLRRLLDEEFRDGAVLDGFPRTRVQVECLKLLVDRLNQLYTEFADTPLAINFRRPTIHAMVLFVSEKTSIARQIERGEKVAAHNKEVEETGVGKKWALRSTDLSEATARRRYRVFKEQTWDALKSLKEIYHYHFINAEGPIEEVEENILAELQYQSSLELDPRTYDRLRPLPLAEEIVVHARQLLVKRLDTYELEHTEKFVRTVQVIDEKFMPIIQRHALSGRAQVNSEDQLFHDPLALSMLIDIFSERGYHAVVDKHIQEIPDRVDLQTGEIHRHEKTVFRFQVNFKGSPIRRG